MARKRYVKWAASLIVVLLAAVLLEPLPNQASEVTVFGPRVYTRDTGKPRVEIDTFTVAIPDGDYTLAVQNGDSPATRGTSAVIFFNGRQLFAPDDFKKQVPLLTVGVALAEENEIRVELRSKPGSFLIISIAGSPHNTPPVADAGPDQVVAIGDLITLDGTGSSDADGDPLTYEWSFVERPPGSQVTLDDPTAVNPTFVVDALGSYVLELAVDDGLESSAPDTVTVVAVNSAPVASAGPDQTVPIGATVTLDGSDSSDMDGDLLTFDWLLTPPAGSSATLSDPAAVMPTFDVDLPGSYSAELVVNDGTVDSAPDTVTITTENSPPVAGAGPDQTVLVGDTVSLDGSTSHDADGNPLTFAWRLTPPAGSSATLSDPTAVMPTFAVDLPGTYSAELVVDDGTVGSAPDTVFISTENSRPVADAGPDQTATVGDTVTLDGSGSFDVDLDPLFYAWSFSFQPPGSTAGLTDADRELASFIPDLAGLYVAQLIVGDGLLFGTPDTATVDVAPLNHPPVITSTPGGEAIAGTLYQYDVEATDPDPGDVLTYSLAAAPLGMTIEPAGGLILWTPTAEQAGTQQVTVRVTDAAGAFDTQTFAITVTLPNRGPAITSTPVTAATPASPYLYDVEATDPDPGDVLTYALDAAPGGMGIDPASGLIEWTPANDQGGASPVSVRVHDAAGAFATQSYTVEVPVVAPINRPPAITSLPITSATAGRIYLYDVEATDPDPGDVLTFSLATAPTGMTIDSVTGLLQWTPAVAQAGAPPVTVRVQDAGGLSATQDFAITVTVPNRPPVAVDDAYEVQQGEQLIIAGLPPATSPATAVAAAEPAARRRAARDYGALPLAFEANQGQTDAAVQYLSRGPGYTLFLTAGEAVLSLKAAATTPAPDTPGDPAPAGQVLRIRLVGANPQPVVTGRDPLPGKSHYFLGNDPSQWRTDVPTYARVAFDEVYPGIDLVYYGNQHRLEYDFVVAPGADPAAIRLAIDGAQQVSLDADGNLILSTPHGEIRQHRPVVYQEIAGERRPLAGRYVLLSPETVGWAPPTDDLTEETTIAGDPHAASSPPADPAVQVAHVGFEVDEYDRDTPLVIDPVLAYSTFVGGSEYDYAQFVAVDSQGNAYVAGNTASLDFPTTSGAFQATKPGGNRFSEFFDGFVAKLSPDGSTLLYATYLGGTTSSDNLNAVAVDQEGHAYVTGTGYSSDFPLTPGAYRSPVGGLAFAAKLAADGATLLYSARVGGDQGLGIAVDADGNAYVTGEAFGSDLATSPGAPQPAYGGGAGDGFILKLNPTGTGLLYATFFGGSGREQALGVAVDESGRAQFTGLTLSADLPTVNPLQATFGGGSIHGDAFVVALNPEGTRFVFATYLGGASDDVGFDIALDAESHVYVTGISASQDFPLQNAFQATFGGAGSGTTRRGDAFVAKIDVAIPALLFSTYLGGRGDDAGYAINIDPIGNIFILGGTDSPDFPLRDPLQASFAGGSFPEGGAGDVFLTRLDPTGSTMLFSTYLGGTGSDSGGFRGGLKVDRCGDAYMAGFTFSADFPTQSALDPSYGGAGDAFVTKVLFEDVTDLAVTKTDAPDPVVAGNELRYTVTVANLCDKAATGVTLTDLLPPQVSLVSATPSQGTCAVAAGTVTCDLGGIAGLASAAVTVVATVNSGETGVLTNQASVTADQDDPDPRNNTATATTNAEQMAGILANDSDPDGDPLTAIRVAGPSHGTLNLNPDGTFTYTPTADFSGTDTFTYHANDGRADSNTATVTLTVHALNGPPVITSTPVTVASTRAPYTYDVEATDPEGDPLTFSLTEAPSGMTLDPATGLLTWTATDTDLGTHTVTVIVEDGHGGSDRQTFDLAVPGGNLPPTIVSAPVTASTVNEPYGYDVAAIDPDGDVLTYSLLTAPAGMTIDPATGLIQWTPANAQVGDHTVSVAVSDGNGGADAQDFTVGVLVNHPPVITSDAVTDATTGEPYLYDVEAIDPDDDPLTYSLIVAQDCVPPPPDFAGWWTGDGAALDIANGNDGEERLGAGYGPGMVGKAFTLDGVDDHVYVPYDPIFHFGENQDFTIDAWINLQNPTPGYDDEIVITGDHQQLRTDPAKTFYRFFVSRDRRTLGLRMGNTNVNFHLESLQIIPLNAWVHVAAVRTGAAASLYINGELDASGPVTDWPLTNGGPLSIGGIFDTAFNPPVQPYNVFGGLIDEVEIHRRAFSDAEIRAIYQAGSLGKCKEPRGLPEGMTFDPATGLIEWTPDRMQAGRYFASVEANDGRGGEDVQTFTLEVAAPPNEPPVITSEPVTTAQVGVPYAYDVVATDPEGDTLTYALTNGDFQGLQGIAADALGNIYVVDDRTFAGRGGVFRVDPISGAQTVVASGGDLVGPTAIAVDGSGNLLVVDPFALDGAGAIIRIDPATGVQTVVTSGGNFALPTGIAIAGDGTLYVSDADAFGGPGGVIRVDAVTGEQAKVSAGGDFVHPDGIAIDANGRLFVLDRHAYSTHPTDIGGGVIEVDPVTGAQTKITSGGNFYARTATGIASVAPDQLVVSAFSFRFGTVVFGVNPDTQAQGLISENGKLALPTGLAAAGSGDILVADFRAFGSGGVLRIDSVTGAQEIVSPTVIEGLSIDSTTGLFEWTPVPGQTGEHKVTVRVTDPGGLSAEQTFSINVAPENRRPTAIGQAFGILRAIPFLPPFWSTSGTITLHGEDPDGDPLTYEVIDPPIHGELTGMPPELTYVPDGCFAGADRLTFRVRDGELDSEIATVDIYVGDDCNRNGVADPLDVADGTSADCNGNGVPDECDVAVEGRGFTDLASWSAYDPGAHGVGTDPDGYAGGAFDGRYVYLAPYFNGSNYSGEVLRFDTQADFGTPEAWSTYDLPTNGVGQNTRGFSGTVFDGRYVYFVPGASTLGEIPRYDTQGDFEARSSWSVYSPRQAGVVVIPTGYLRAVFDGRYVYFVPNVKQDGSLSAHGTVLRLDTTGEFAAPQAWSVFDPGDHGVGTDPDGFAGAAFDGRYLYLVPLDSVGNGNGYDGEVLRYDTQSDFLQATSWSVYDSSVHGMIVEPHGYFEAAYDGRYIYFGPYLRSGLVPYGQVLRYDTQLGFQDASAWSTFDPGAQGVGQTPGGYRGVVYDCENVYFVPNLADYASRTFHSETLRYDTAGAFQSVDSWAAYNPVTTGLWNVPQGYDGAVFDGRYIYFVPTHDNVNDGTFLRYDTWIGTPDAQGNGIPDTCESHAPVIVSTPVTAAVVGSPYAYDVDATDPDVGDTLAFSLDTGPAGIAIDPASGLIQWTPGVDQLGSHDVVVRVSDAAGYAATQRFMIAVESGQQDHAPVVTSTPPGEATVGVLYTYDVDATDPDGDTLTFSLDTAPTGMAIDAASGLIQWTPSEDQIGDHPVVVRVDDGVCCSVTQSFTLVVERPNGPPSISSLPPGGATVGVLYAYDVEAVDPDGDSLTYSLDTAPAGMVIDAVSGLIQWTPAEAQIGDHAVVVRVEDSRGAWANQSFTLVVERPDNPPEITSVPTGPAVVGQLYVYDAEATDPDAGDVLTFALDAYPAGMTIDAATGLVQWTPAAAQVGSHPVTVRVEDGHGGFATQSFTLPVVASNSGAPDFTSSPPAVATVGVVYAYDANATDPDGDTVTFALDAAPAGMGINAASGLIQWTPTEAQIGTHGVTVRAADGRGGFATQSFAVAVAAVPNEPPVITSTAPTAAIVGEPYLYHVTATDPDPGDALIFFLVAPAPAGMTLDPASGLLQWLPSEGQAGAHDVTVQVADSRGALATQTFTVTVTAPPAVPLAAVHVDPPSALVLVGQSQPFTAVGILDDGAAESVAGRVTWESSDPAVATIDGSGRAFPAGAGTTTIRALVGGVAGTATLTVQESVANDSPPTAEITSPADGATVTGPVPVVGTASDPEMAKYVLDLATVGTAQFATLAEGTAPVTGSTLGTLDPTLLINDLYTLRLTVYDRGGFFVRTAIQVQVAREQKVGNFTLAFQDLTLPVACQPITVTRVYDSRDKGQGDFGVGWRLDVKTVRLRETDTMGADWYVDLINQPGPFGFPIPTYVLLDGGVHKVALTLPDGQVEEFDLTPQPAESPFNPITQVGVTYTPRPRTLGSLAADGVANVDLLGETGWVDLLSPDLEGTFDPRVYRYTTAEGTAFTIDKFAGVQEVECTNGQTLTYTAGGILHSAGKGVTFTRDGQGRITALTDPNGNVHRYEYDGNGDLARSIDPEGNATAFAYDRRHDLLEVEDPRGVRAIRNEYDDAGRLISTTDPAGHQATFAHDLAARTETVTDRLGHVTTYDYDADGNVLAQTDALENVTTYTYDAFGNQLTTTDPLGRTTERDYDLRRNLLQETDPLGNITHYTYTALNAVRTITDPLGRVATNAYDAHGNLLSTTDPQGHQTTHVYDDGGVILAGTGNLLSTTDALGHTTHYDYDASGNLTGETDALGNATTYTYDANGNRLSESRTRTVDGTPETLVTTFEYDGNNRLVQTTQPDGSTTRTEYNALGKQARTIDALGHATTYEYDDAGRLTATTYPDGTSESSTYDAEGRRLTSTDRAGRVTSHAYDALGRLTQTTFPDGTATSTTYDAAGQVIATTDPLGHVTSYEYDDAGRRTKVSDALGHATTFTYDDAGNQTVVTDANGHTVRFEYDENNRRVKTIHPDGTTDQVAYDALGRQGSKTDPAGVTTAYHYDALGRLTGVTDALDQETSYTYDAQGNQVTQTDANGHTTTFTYDALGRRVSRTLPLGMTETLAYDDAGNLTSKTDFNGHTTTYAYDAVNRLVSKTPDPALGEATTTFTYTATGQRAGMTDPSGETAYAYDDRDRLIAKATPQGTLTYTYDDAGNLTSIQSSHPGGASMTYAYNALNRLASVTDASGATTYAYDAVGNLASYRYPNGVEHAYAYDTLNRLTDLTVTSGAAPIARYAYTLGPAGNRLSVAELSGRVVQYGYDALYRLTGETIGGDPDGVDGTIGYLYDPVGNRLTRTSTVSGIDPQTFTYDANDRITSESYDANGNTLVTVDGRVFAYDSDNRLIGADPDVTFLYDGDGNRVARTVDGVTTEFLVDTLNPTGYSQVLEEIENDTVVRSYTYGLDLVSQSQSTGVSYYGYDGHGSVRVLTDAAGNVTDGYAYDAFGNVIAESGGTGNVYLYAGEQADRSVGLQYLRARYLSSYIARFVTADTYSGNSTQPITANRYIFANANPTNAVDPSGEQALYLDLVASIYLRGILFDAYQANYGLRRVDRYYIVPPPRSENFEVTTTLDVLLAVGPRHIDIGAEALFAEIKDMHTGETGAYRFFGVGFSLGPQQVLQSPISGAVGGNPQQGRSFRSQFVRTVSGFEGFGYIESVGAVSPIAGVSRGCLGFWADSVCGLDFPQGWSLGYSFVVGYWSFIGPIQ